MLSVLLFPFCAMHTKKKTYLEAYFISLFKTKMAYKKNMILWGLMVLLGGVFFWSAQAGTTGTITFDWFAPWDTISSKYSMVHFGLPNGINDYQGGVFWLPSIELKSAEILTYDGASDPNKTRTCRKQIRWLYYNEQRGKRLWPMDQASLNYLKQINNNYASLLIAGGWYTTCSGWQNHMAGTDIYGQITFTDTSNWTIKTTLSAWLMYTINNIISPSPIGLFPSLAYYNNETPVGYLFDSNGGVWFVGGRFDGHEDLLNGIADDNGINDIFTGSTKSGICYNGNCIDGNLEAWLDSAWNLAILGNTLLSRWGLDLNNRKSIIWNIGSMSAIMFSDLINTSDILNGLRRNASSLCLGKEWITPLDSMTEEGSVVCIKDPNGYAPVVIDLSNPSSYNKKDIVVQGKDVILKNTMNYVDWDELPTLNVFIDQWNLYLKPDTPQFNGQTTGSYWMFDANALPVWFTWGVTTGNLLSAPQFAYGQLLRWNIFVNGVVAGFSGSDIYNPAPWIMPNKYYIYGRLASLNTALAPSEKRKIMVRSMFWENTKLVDYLSLSSDVFLWTCGLWAVGSFGTDLTPCAVPWDRFKESAFILVKEYIPTNLFQ